MQPNAATLSERRGHVRKPHTLRRSGLRGDVQLLWEELDDLAREAQHVTMTVADLAARIGVCARTVRRRAAELVAAGFLRIEGQRGANGATTWTPLGRARPITRGRAAVVKVFRRVAAANGTGGVRPGQGECDTPVSGRAVPSQHPAREKKTRAYAGGVSAPATWRQEFAAARQAAKVSA